MNPGVANRYRGRYPRFGQVAVLCEGDCAGFELDLLEKWLSSRDIFADVWPCGRKSDLFGMSDAIGRSIPIVVIEDRDHRSCEEAKRECEAKRDKRLKRSVRLQEWRSWRRNEIENYLIEPEVCVPVLSEAFDQPPDAIKHRLAQLIPQLAIDQAAQATIAIFVDRLPERGDFVPGLSRKEARPQWDRVQMKFIVPEFGKVETALRRVIQEKANSFRGALAPTDAPGLTELLKKFGGLCSHWCKVDFNTPDWRIDWAGKDILSILIRWLSGEFGWSVIGKTRERVDWANLSRDDADKCERDIMAVLQGYLVSSFLNAVATNNVPVEIREEWSEIAEIVRAAIKLGGGKSQR
ncbi:MAG: hypothetical protein HOP29_08200 [Phycisphaerales bacterium]|nr:hypothetical protein [Phycisphaerales bacterium]